MFLYTEIQSKADKVYWSLLKNRNICPYTFYTTKSIFYSVKKNVAAYFSKIFVIGNSETRGGFFRLLAN